MGSCRRIFPAKIKEFLLGPLCGVTPSEKLLPKITNILFR